ncbi:MAG: single-stranded-DNA-specific exonuclease RecJ [Candidatus Kerfeldbacteria bacterium]|nr:single-stranded-DNA-specific exonuclease RecJ [Candidatus Kerfeldbacteria bacterium]
MKRFTWITSEAPSDSFIHSVPELPRLVATFLWQRGFQTEAAVSAWLDLDYHRDLGDPWRYAAMKTAVDRIMTAIEDQQPVTVYGDYDVDGLSATAIMVESLQALGGQVDWYIPERLGEGYGLNVAAIESLAAAGTKLLITVDLGSTNVAEIQRAKELGMETIVIDHHHQPDHVPEAAAIINPVFTDSGYPFPHQCSTAVAFTVVRALLQATDDGKKLHRPLPPGWEKWLLDLVGLATVADMMPLRGENRLFVKFGLLVLRKTRRPGLRALVEVMGGELAEVDEYSIGFQLAPRINAAGRLNRPHVALKLLLTTNRQEARLLAAELQAINQDRQKLTELAVAEAFEQIQTQADQQAYVAFAPHWAPGIIGLVAGRLAERYWRPVLVMTEHRQSIIGSGRSIPGIDIMHIFDQQPEHFQRFGGHPGACGFTLVSVAARENFSAWFLAQVRLTLPAVTSTKPLQIDGRANIDDFTAETIDGLAACGPFGQDYGRPKFLLSDLVLTSIKAAGADGQHLRLTVRQRDAAAKLIGFRLGALAADLAIGQRIEAVVEASWNTWNGRREVQLKMIDLDLQP